MTKLLLSSKVSEIKGVGTSYTEILNSRGIYSVGDFLRIFPSEYIDPSGVSSKIEPGTRTLYLAEVKGIRVSRGWGRNRGITIIDATVCGQHSELVIFNQPYLRKNLDGVEKVFFIGKGELINSRYRFSSPVIFKDLPETGIKPLYKKLGPMGSGRIWKFMGFVLENLEGETEFLPESVILSRKIEPLIECFRKIHYPLCSKDIEEGLFRLKYMEFFFFCLELKHGRRLLKPLKREYNYRIDGEIKKALRGSVAFDLTEDQKSSVRDIFTDLKKRKPMSRLLLGDVGTGKTVVAFVALMVTIQNGYQGALMAPTEILVEQHFRKAEAFFKGFKVAKLTASMKASEKKSVLEGLESGDINLVLGTHSLMGNRVVFRNLSMVVVDEQHRFGVAQRAALCYKSRGTDLMVMTATPIPRTLLLSIFKDLSLSVIKEKPALRKPIKTEYLVSEDREQLYGNLRKKVAEGDKIYVVLPLVEDSEFQPELLSVEGEIGWFRKTFGRVNVGYFTGRTKPENRDKVMRDFLRGEIKVMISTTVIEVGIDVPDATVMVIENADRYGMAQLHQLRGRVGRGEKESRCYLVAPEQVTLQASKRLETVTSCGDGFILAEEDLKLRGGGEVFGFSQSGGIKFSLGDLTRDYDIFKKAEEDIALLKEEEYTEYIKNYLDAFEKRLEKINFS